MIGKNIYEIRRKKGYTLSELAKRSGVSKSYISNIERNLNRNPSIQVLEKISRELDVDLETLIRTKNTIEDQNLLESEERDWIDLVNQFKESGINKVDIQDYKTLFEFIKWHNQNLHEKNKNE